MHDNAGTRAQVLGDVGINVQQMQDINLDINPIIQNNNMAKNMEDEGVVQMEVEEVENWVP